MCTVTLTFTLCCRREKCLGRKNITILVVEEQKRTWCRISDRKHLLTDIAKAALSERLVMIHISLPLNEIIIYLWELLLSGQLYLARKTCILIYIFAYILGLIEELGFFPEAVIEPKYFSSVAVVLSSAVMGQILGKPTMLCILFHSCHRNEKCQDWEQ